MLQLLVFFSGLTMLPPAPPPSHGGDLSPFATVVAFDPVLRLARVPVPAGQGDDPAKGPFVLAFRSEEAWRQAWRTCKDKIATQCEAGAKVSCSLTAARACQARPWWMPPFFFGGRSSNDDDDGRRREECEEREMRGCVVSSQDRCAWYARETCDPVYADMRIAAPGAPVDPRFSGRPLRRPRVTRHDKLKDQDEALPVEEEEEEEEERPSLGVTTFRGRLLMQQERHHNTKEWERMPQWSAQAAAANQEVPKEGWVGGLVHPAPRKPQAPLDSPKQSSDPLEWLHKLHHSVMARFGN